MNMRDLGARIRARREALLITQEELAACVGVTYQAVQAWERGSLPRPKKLDKIAACLRTSTDELFHGKTPHESGTYPVISSTQTVQIVELKGRVPVISWTLAGNWTEASKTFHPGDAERWIRTTAEVGMRSFALIVTGDSMEPKVPSGSVVVIDPDRQVEPGKIVLAHFDNTTSLRLYVIDGTEPFLRPFNNNYPTVSGVNAQIIGVAVQLTSDL